MNISWSSTDHLNGDVVDDASGQVLFHLATPYTLFKQGITTMTDGEGQVVAEYGSRLSHDQVTYKGQTRRVSDWFPADGFFTTYVTNLPWWQLTLLIGHVVLDGSTRQTGRRTCGKRSLLWSPRSVNV